MSTFLAYLPDPLFAAARCGIPDLVRVGSLAEVRARVRTTRVDGVICDPVAGAASDATDIFWLATDFPALHITLYTVLEPGVAQVLTRLASAGVTDVVLFGYEDAPGRWGDLVARAAVRDAVTRTIVALGPTLKQVGGPLRDVLEGVFRAPCKFHTVDDLAAAAGLTRRSVYRRLERVGVHAVHDWIEGARLTGAFALLRDPARQVRDVAGAVGYGGPQELSVRLRGWTGRSVAQLRESVTADEFVEHTVGRLAPRQASDGVPGRANARTAGRAGNDRQRHA
ncbi:MAG: helix-turn-helix domain-containing protein [Gemmatimonadaceae bacterium]